MKKKVNSTWTSPKVIAAVLILLIILGSMFFFGKPSGKYESAHLHAAFQIYINDNLQDFSLPQYMHIKPCGDTELDLQLPQERAHLHDGIGDVVHVHSAKATWGDLFTTLGVEVDTSTQYYLNDKFTINMTSQAIKPYDRALILIGTNEDIEKKLEQVPDINDIERAEQIIENC